MHIQSHIIQIDKHEDILKYEQLKSLTEKLDVEFNWKGSNPDLIIIGEEAQVSIDKTRELAGIVSRKPFAAEIKVVVIYVDGIGIEAQNSLLKTLEEPPINTLIILVSTNPELLLPTVRSRCKIEVWGAENPNNDKYRELAVQFLGINSYNERMQLINGHEELLKNRGEAADFINTLIATYLDRIKANPNMAINKKMVDLLWMSFKGITRNTNIKLTFQAVASSINL